MRHGKLIVVEGMDNAGKTTLAQKIAKQLRATYIKVERPVGGPDLMHFQGILNVACAYGTQIVVTDRHVAISEPIYGKVIRGGHELDVQEIDVCTRAIDILVYCRPPDHVLMSTISDRAQMEGVVENASKLILAYDEAVYRLGHDVLRRPKHAIIRYDFTNDTDQMFFGRLHGILQP